jgi:hypothetical protein
MEGKLEEKDKDSSNGKVIIRLEDLKEIADTLDFIEEDKRLATLKSALITLLMH